MGKRSRDKGAAFEREVAARFRDLTGLNDSIRRGRQDSKDRFVGGTHEPDVVGVPGLWIEAKRVASAPRLATWWGQAVADAEKARLDPVVVFRVDRGPIMFLMSLARVKFQTSAVALRDFSLTRYPSARVRWGELLRADAAQAFVMELTPPAVLGRWGVFEELWRSRFQ